MTIELDEADALFIYLHFQKQLSEIDKIASSKNCPFDKATIKNQKAPYLSVVDKIGKQVPKLKQMDNFV